jgi:hypothetical protein
MLHAEQWPIPGNEKNHYSYRGRLPEAIQARPIALGSGFCFLRRYDRLQSLVLSCLLSTPGARPALPHSRRPPCCTTFAHDLDGGRRGAASPADRRKCAAGPPRLHSREASEAAPIIHSADCPPRALTGALRSRPPRARYPNCEPPWKPGRSGADRPSPFPYRSRSRRS